MRFSQLECLVAVVNTGSVTAAAQKLFMSQQAVSASIKQLEEDLQCVLMVRNKKGIYLTEKGLETVEFARHILQEKENFCKKIKQDNLEEQIMINICSTSSVINVVLPNVIDRMEAQKYKVSISITLADKLDTVFNQVENGNSDIGLLTFNADELPEYFADFTENQELEILAQDEMIAVLNKKFISSDLVQISRKEITSRRTSYYNIIPTKNNLELAKKIGIVWSNDAEFHRAMLERNGTIVLMPSFAYQFFFSTKKYSALSFSDLEAPLVHVAVYRKDTVEYVKEFINLIRLEMHIK